jgi:large subunit ribosomal protein L33
MAKTKKDTLYLVSSVASGYSYAIRRNRKKIKGEKKLSLRKYDPLLRKHVVFGEKKLSKLKKKFKRDVVLSTLNAASSGSGAGEA